MNVPLDGGRDASGAMADAAAGPSAVTLTAGPATNKLGTGNDPVSHACSSGQALIGYTGANAAYSPSPLVGMVSGTCGALGVDGTLAPTYTITSGPGTMLPPHGTGIDSAWDLPCPPNEFVVGVAVRVGGSLDNLALQCAPLSLVRSGAAWAGHVGTITVTKGQGGTGGAPDTATCAAGQVATGYESEILNDTVAAIGLLCSSVAAR